MEEAEVEVAILLEAAQQGNVVETMTTSQSDHTSPATSKQHTK